MSERAWMEPIVERVVSQVLESHSVQLRDEIVKRVMEEIEAQPAAAAAPAANANSSDLARAVTEIQTGASQKEILRALLDGCSRYAARTALFVVKGTHASGWQGRGFSSADALKDFALDGNAPAVLRAITDRVVVNAQTADLDSRFLQEFGTPVSGEARLLPLLLKDKVAALIYADGGTDGKGQLDSGSLELLVLSTSAWLEINSLRKQVQKEPAADSPSSERSEPRAMAATPAPAFNDPFASHSPGHAMAAAASAEVSTPVMSAEVEAPAAVAEPLPAISEEPATPAAPEVPAASTEEQDTHRKAQRFARLLVDEIKLYNQAQVAEGRKHKDLYDRLKEAIEKSRGTYQKRYGNTVASSGNYFQHELVRSLAEDDLSIMGTNFKH
jgi:hypothetical protein